jgi:DNA-binding CsgD family transcriptional regulator
MYCRGCGRINRIDAIFCDGCGARLTAPAVTLGFTPTAEVVPVGREQKHRQPDHIRVPARLQEGEFVGRQREMEVLRADLEAALSGRGRLVMLVGNPGIGKTRTAQELAGYAEERGARVLWGRCYETPGAPPFWPWGQVIRTYVRDREAEALRGEMGAGAADIAEIMPEVREQLSDLPPVSPIADPEQARFRLFDSITTFLSRASKNQALVVVLDNLHWADKSSLLLLEFLARELAHSRTLIVGTYRDIELSRQHPLSETLAELTREDLLQRAVLRGLSRDEVERLIALAAGSAPPPTLVDVLHARTEGNPLFLTELVRLLIQEEEFTPERWHPQQGLSLKIPEGVREVIGRRLNRLSQPCVQMLTLASVIGREFSVEEVAWLIENVSEEGILQLLDEAATARVIEELPQAVGRYQFSHVLIRETLYDELPATRRVRLHRRIAETMEELYKDNLEPHLDRLAYHFLESAKTGDVDKAVFYAERAGASADALFAYEEAVSHYEMALQILEQKHADDLTRCFALLLTLGEVQRKAGDFSQALQSFQRAAAVAKTLGSPEGLARAALGFEETAWRPGLPGDAAVRLCEEALMALGEGDSALKARVLGGLTRALAFTGAFAQGTVIGKQAVEMARRLGDSSTLTATLRTSLYARYARWGLDHNEERLATATEMVRLAEEAGDRSMALEAHLWRLFDLMELGDIPAVDQQLAIYTRLALDLRQPFQLYSDRSFRAMRAIFEGRFAEGERDAQEALAIGQRLRGQDALGLFGVQMFTLRREQGRLREVAPAVRHFVQMSPEASRWRPGLALIYSELGLVAEARAEFEHLAAQNFADVPRDALWILCMVYLAEVCVFLGDTARAATLYQLLLPYDGHNLVAGPHVACYGAASRHLGMLAATLSRWDDAQRHFEQALAMNTRMGAKPWLAHTQFQYAKMLLARARPGAREQATLLLDQALSISRQLGMDTLQERATALMEQTRSQANSTRTYPGGLTPREVEVLRLIASGKSNRDIAEALFISLNTVANHVRNILAKIGAVNRTEAAAYAIRHGLAPSTPSPLDSGHA